MIRNLGAIVLFCAVSGSRLEGQSPPPIAVGVTVKGSTMGKLPIVDVSEFHPAVAAIDSGGVCETMPAGPMRPGEHGFLYAFGPREKRVRSVVVVVDTLNRFVRYSDIRGDLRAPFDGSVSENNPLGLRTTITLNVGEGTGVLRNSKGSQDLETVQVRGTALVDAVNLGVPRRMIERVVVECGRN